jgi:hypothetical protein
MRNALIVLFVLVTCCTLNAVNESERWARFRNEHRCEIIPRVALEPRTYVCDGVPCKGPRDCAAKINHTKE